MSLENQANSNLDADYLKIGFIRKPHGLRGELKVLPLTDNPERFKDLDYVYLEKKGKVEKYEVDFVRKSHGEVLLKLKVTAGRNEAELYRNMYIYVEREDGVELGEWEFYSQDLIGCTVVFEEREIGVVVDLLNAGANDNLLVRTAAKKEYYYPFLREFLDGVDIEAKRIYISEYEGFFD